MGLSEINRTIKWYPERVNCPLIRSNYPLSWGNHCIAKRKIPKPLVYAQVFPLGSPFALDDPLTVTNADAPKVG